jgi:hypothetical protein
MIQLEAPAGQSSACLLTVCIDLLKEVEDVGERPAGLAHLDLTWRIASSPTLRWRRSA